MATVLDKELRRLVTIEGLDYTLTIEPNGFRLTGKGKRKPEIELLWRDLLSGETAMATALNASLQSALPGKRSKTPSTVKPAVR